MPGMDGNRKIALHGILGAVKMSAWVSWLEWHQEVPLSLSIGDHQGLGWSSVLRVYFLTLGELSSIPGTHKPEEIPHDSSAVVFSLGSLEFGNNFSYAAEPSKAGGAL